MSKLPSYYSTTFVRLWGEGERRELWLWLIMWTCFETRIGTLPSLLFGSLHAPLHAIKNSLGYWLGTQAVGIVGP